MASLFDYMSGGVDRYKDRKAPTGYSFRTTSSGKDRYTPVNELNRANRYKRSPGEVGGGRSNLDARRGFSNQGIGSLPSSRQPGLFGSYALKQPTILPEEEDQFTFEDRGLGRNFVEDSSTMIKIQ